MTRLGACDAMKSGEWRLPGKRPHSWMTAKKSTQRNATVTRDENATSPEVIADRYRRGWVRSDALFRLVAPDAMLTRPGIGISRASGPVPGANLHLSPSPSRAGGGGPFLGRS
jgi:hypothetical protein